MAKDKPPLRAVDHGEEGNHQDDTKGAESTDSSLRRKGIFLLPNVITTGALFAGFYAIIAAMNGDFLPAVLAVFIAMFLDTADGRVARITMSESAFGAQYDSLSDMVAFGVAPAVVAFSWGLSSLGQFGWVATFVYMACAALRLARFNTESDSASFTGLASPSAAGLVTFSIWVALANDVAQPSFVLASVMAVVTAGAGLLMVSNFSYYSPKTINLRERIPFVTLVLIALAFAVVTVDPPAVLLTLCVAYSISGPLKALLHTLQNRASKPE
ncbi:MAG: phosphatidylcholine/phosphatidylserine synthase [Pseudomonadota bacterium]|nr:phosphatidylcholine/phosphatidylserine synthase [Pseudomonadota bacterium]